MNEGQKNILVGAAVVLGVLLWQWADGQPPGTALLNAAFFGPYQRSFLQSGGPRSLPGAGAGVGGHVAAGADR